MKKWIGLGLMVVMAQISWAEFAATKNFKWADVNRNGMVTQEEFVAIRALWAARRGEAADDQQSVRIFKNKDRDRDGELTPEEFRLR